MAITRPFLFLRHGETEWNAEGRVQGRLETRLSDVGRRQAEEAAERLSALRIDRIVASPLMRVRDTAERIAARQRLDVVYDPDLAECALGEAEGKTRGRWLKDYWAGRETPDGGESFETFAARAYGALRRAVDRDHVLVVAHGGVWRALRAHARLEPDFWIANAAPVWVAPGRPVWRARPLDGVDAAMSEAALANAGLSSDVGLA